MKRKKKIQKRFFLIAAALIVCVCGFVYYYAFSSVSNRSETEYVYITPDDTMDSVCDKIEPMANKGPFNCLRIIMRHAGYSKSLKTGRYAIRPGEGAIAVYRHLSRGLQTSLELTIPEVRTVEDLAGRLSDKLMLDSLDIVDALTDSTVCARYSLNTNTIISLFIPNTYDVYWDISIDKLLSRMQRENEAFWTSERKAKAEAKGLTPLEVMTIASIVDEETANNGEKPMVAGMYINRLHKGMPLQADPTIKFALKNFLLRRIYKNMLNVDSPYNTYRNAGLPPGPIRIASIAGIDAVLNAVEHNYLYMCAKEDFSGTHNFAVTYAEHLLNAAKYSKALNERGIK